EEVERGGSGATATLVEGLIGADGEAAVAGVHCQSTGKRDVDVHGRLLVPTLGPPGPAGQAPRGGAGSTPGRGARGGPLRAVAAASAPGPPRRPPHGPAAERAPRGSRAGARRRR